MARSPHKYTGILNTATRRVERVFLPVDVSLPAGKEIIGGDTLQLFLASAGQHQAKIGESAFQDFLSMLEPETRLEVEQQIRGASLVVAD